MSNTVGGMKLKEGTREKCRVGYRGDFFFVGGGGVN